MMDFLLLTVLTFQVYVDILEINMWYILKILKWNGIPTVWAFLEEKKIQDNLRKSGKFKKKLSENADGYTDFIYRHIQPLTFR